MLPEHIKQSAGITNENLENQISTEFAQVLVKIHSGEVPTLQERQMLINPVEASAIVSLKSHRVVTHRYIKEIARPRMRKEDPPKRRRLEPAKIAGTTNLYRLGDVYDLEPIKEKREDNREDDQEDSGKGSSVQSPTKSPSRLVARAS